MAIGITERGDAALDLSWYDRLNEVDAAVIITKAANKPMFREKLIAAHNNGHKLILHATCTGMGGTAFEPNVPDYKTVLDGIKQIVENGFPIEQIVLRVDPIFPDNEHLQIAKTVIDDALALLPELSRIRISVMDLHYRHLQDRFRAVGIALPHTFKSEAYIDPQFATDLIEIMTPYADRLSIETCAEPLLTGIFKHNGCVSNRDMDILGLPHIETAMMGRQRPGACTCLPKTELLARRGQCPHRCIYCFWK